VLKGTEGPSTKRARGILNKRRTNGTKVTKKERRGRLVFRGGEAEKEADLGGTERRGKGNFSQKKESWNNRGGEAQGGKTGGLGLWSSGR